MSTSNIVKEPAARAPGDSVARQDATAMGQGMPLKSNKPNLATRDSRYQSHEPHCRYHPADDTEPKSFERRNWAGEGPKHNRNALELRGASGNTRSNKLGNSKKKGG